MRFLIEFFLNRLLKKLKLKLKLIENFSSVFFVSYELETN